jgi:CPA2 family monovalent cation:H+ antiporter-2
MNIEGLIGDLALILMLGAVVTLIFKKLKQPIVLGYIVAGFVASSNFKYFPTVGNEANIEFWAEIGIIVLLFCLGLEFSFKKLMNVGGSAAVTALIIVGGMMGLGFTVGGFLDYNFINRLFLGGMLSMSSTTIIIKAFTDLNMRQRRFVPHVLAVLICEDLFAVVMMVLLSSVALNNSVEGSEMLYSIGKLVFFLVICFTVGVYVLPTFFARYRRLINDEMLLIISVGLCMLMAVFSVFSGFSMALGAFIMGSILAGTNEAEHIEKVMKPVKDLFGAVFFISVGMMVNPSIISEYWTIILLLSIVVIVGMIVFGTVGMLATGQPLKIAIESGFSLTQIGEFAFIIASLGMSLGVLDATLYPIVVAVSVITTFFTPYFIKWAIPCYEWTEKHLPKRVVSALETYSKNATTDNATSSVWKTIIGRYSWRILLYSVVIIAMMWLTINYVVPFAQDLIGMNLGKALAVLLSLAAMTPFFMALTYPSTKRSERQELQRRGNKFLVPLVVLTILRLVIAFALVEVYVGMIYSHGVGVACAVVAVVLLLFLLTKRVGKRMKKMESKFVRNLNERELRKSGKGNTLVSDFHLAYLTVGYTCPFVGERLCNSGMRKKYGANVVSIQRGANLFPIPSADMRLFPGDVVGIVGTEEQIQSLLTVIEDSEEEANVAHSADANNMSFVHFAIEEGSVLVGKTSATARLREDYMSLLVAIQRGEEYKTPNGQEVFEAGDVLWLVGDNKKIEALKTN